MPILAEYELYPSHEDFEKSISHIKYFCLLNIFFNAGIKPPENLLIQFNKRYPKNSDGKKRRIVIEKYRQLIQMQFLPVSDEIRPPAAKKEKD